jgi:hypothetical protein
MSDKIILTFTHPRSSESRKAEVGPKTTVAQAIEGLVDQKFLEPPNEDRRYAVSLAGSGKQIANSATFFAAGARDGDTIAITETSMGAGR